MIIKCKRCGILKPIEIYPKLTYGLCNKCHRLLAQHMSQGNWLMREMKVLWYKE